MKKNNGSISDIRDSTPVWKRWAVGGTTALCAAAIVGGAAFSASAATPTPTTSPSATATHATAAKAKAKAKAGHKAGHVLRAELHTVIKNGNNAGDLAAAEAINIVDRHSKLVAALPAALQNDLKTLADAPASARTADAAKIKASAIGGTYGVKIQTEAKRVEAKIAKNAATTK